MKSLTLVCNLALLSVCFKTVNGFYKTVDAGQSVTEMKMDEDCTEVWCEKYSFSEVEKMYRGLFMTKFEFLLKQIIFYLDRDVILYHEGVKDFKYILGSDGDGDSCCVTRQATFINYTIQNVMGQPRSIVHLTSSRQNLYQFITQAECVGVGKCDGICVLEETVRTVLVYHRNTLMFDQVLVPSYCSCKRTG